MKMDLSAIPEDIIPINAKYLFKFDIKYKFNKKFRNKNDNSLIESYIYDVF